MVNQLIFRFRGAVVVVVAACALGGCEHHHHDHEAEPEARQFTVWGERHEVFSEHPPVIAKEPTRFVTHVTDLKTGEPRRDGSIAFELQQGNQTPVQHVEKAPSRPGIYEPMLTFPTAGEWRVKVSLASGNGDITLDLPPITVFETREAAEENPASKPPEGITFLKEQQWRVGVLTQPVGERTLVEHIRLPATVLARPGSLAQVVAPTAGRLTAATGQPFSVVGDKVEAGQVLAHLQPSFSEVAARFAEAEAEVVRTKLQMDQAQLAFERIEKLARVEAKSGRELQEAEFQLKSARAAHEAALALQATYRQASTNAATRGSSAQPVFELRSPIAGAIIEQSPVALGQYVPAEKPLFTILDASTVFIEAHIPEANIARLGGALRASYALPGEVKEHVPITGDAGGRLVFLGIRVDPGTRSAPLVYEMPNPAQRLRVGQSLSLYVETKRAEETLALPEETIVQEGGRPVAFVQLAGETFEKRDLLLGFRDKEWVQVLGGLQAGERVVMKGAYAVRLASVSSALPAHGHAH